MEFILPLMLLIVDKTSAQEGTNSQEDFFLKEKKRKRETESFA
jgi:hypothetical protein